MFQGHIYMNSHLWSRWSILGLCQHWRLASSLSLSLLYFYTWELGLHNWTVYGQTILPYIQRHIVSFGGREGHKDPCIETLKLISQVTLTWPFVFSFWQWFPCQIHLENYGLHTFPRIVSWTDERYAHICNNPLSRCIWGAGLGRGGWGFGGYQGNVYLAWT